MTNSVSIALKLLAALYSQGLINGATYQNALVRYA